MPRGPRGEERPADVIGTAQRQGASARGEEPERRARRGGMPRDGAIVFGDPVAKLDVLNVECTKCGRFGRYTSACAP